MFEIDVSLGQGLSLIKCLYSVKYDEARSWLTVMYAMVQIFDNNSSAVNLILLLIIISVFLTHTADLCNLKGFRLNSAVCLILPYPPLWHSKSWSKFCFFIVCHRRDGITLYWGRWDKYQTDFLESRWKKCQYCYLKYQ